MYFSMKVAIILVWGGVRDFNKRFQRDLMSFPDFETVCCFLSTLKQRKQHFVVRFGPKMSSKYLKNCYKAHFPMKVAIILVWGGVRDFTKCVREDLMSVYWFWNCALLFINVEATKTTLCSQSCPKMISVWSRIGLSLVWDWSRIGMWLVCDWYGITVNCREIMTFILTPPCPLTHWKFLLCPTVRSIKNATDSFLRYLQKL